MLLTLIAIIAGLSTIPRLNHTEVSEPPQTDFGFNTKDIFSVDIKISPTQQTSRDQRAETYRHLLQSIQDIPGVQSASIASAHPLRDAPMVVRLRGQATGIEAEARFNSISSGYFQTMRIPLLRGRFFTGADTKQAPQIAVIDEALSRELFPQEEPIGKVISIVGVGTCEVVGLVSNVTHSSNQKDDIVDFYVPYSQYPISDISLLVRSSAESRKMIDEVTRQIQATDSRLVISNGEVLSEAVSSLAPLSAPQLGLPDLIIPALVLSIMFLFSRSQAALYWMSPLRSRLVVFTLGAVSLLVPEAFRFGSLIGPQVMDALAAGSAWIIFYEIARRAKNRIGSQPTGQFLGLTALIWILEGPVNMIVFRLMSLVHGWEDFSLVALQKDIWTAAEVMTHYPYNIFNLLDAITFVGVSYCLSAAGGFQVEPKKSHFWESRYFGGTGGHQDMEMSSSRSHTTRLLCASVFLSGTAFRKQVLQFLEDPNRAVAPELGTDLRLVAQVCKSAQDRDRKFDWFFGACAILALFGVIVHPFVGIVVLVLSGTGVYITKVWPEQFSFVRRFAKTAFDPEEVAKQFAAQLEPEQYGSLPGEDQNLVAYQGFSPFVGAGTSLGGWSFVVNVDKGRDDGGAELEPLKFQPSELYAEIEQSVEALALNGLSHRNMFFVHGSDIRDDVNILPNSYGRPVQTIAASQASKYMYSNDSHVRHYKWIRVMDWGNELTTSYFLRCTLRGSSMFVEINRYVLTPLATPYRTVDAQAEEDREKGVRIAMAALIVGPVKALLAPLVLFGRVLEYFADKSDAKEKHRAELIDRNPLYNYGVARSFREATCSNQFMHYFQKVDGDFHLKVLEREILAAIVDFLDEHNVDTSELKERQSTILNSGIIVHGGDVKAESLAVGTGAQAVQVSSPESLHKPKPRRMAGREV